MQLTELVVGDQWNQMKIIGSTDVNIVGLTADSRMVEPGFLFAALEGERTDGIKFIPDAIARGAVAILAPSGTQLESYLENSSLVSLITANNPRLQYAELSARYFASQPDTVVAVTGTNGKSSVVEFVRQLWTLAGVPAASLGTLGLVTPSAIRSSKLTTPDPADLHMRLGELSRAGINHLALEASSHGLAQYRLDGVQVSVAAFTNLSRDHLEYHSSRDDYLAAKTRLFSVILSSDGTAILNQDDTCFEFLCNTLIKRKIKILSYGWQGKDLCINDLSSEAAGQCLEVTVLGRHQSIRLPLTGDFQVMNAICALGIVLAIGSNQDDTIGHLENIVGVPGRMELAAKLSNGAAVYVDYAHTPDALESVLSTLRQHTDRRLHVVFGCGGDRDTGKRGEMGYIAASFADRVIITDDNPRMEDAASIRRQILESCNSAMEIADRGEAIFEAVSGLEPGDLLVVAGKGHERGQIIGDKERPFDDVKVVEKAVMAQNAGESKS